MRYGMDGSTLKRVSAVQLIMTKPFYIFSHHFTTNPMYKTFDLLRYNAIKIRACFLNCLENIPF